jgi:hypothetical protein
MLGGVDEKFPRGQGDPIDDRTVVRLRPGILNLGRIGHHCDNPLGRLDWIVLVLVPAQN